jgi:xylan 1,4-beta-xylosidase
MNRLSMAALAIAAVMLAHQSRGQQSEIRPSAPVETRRTQLPPVMPLFDYRLRDTSIAVGHDGAFYLTGTTGGPNMWAVTGDIEVYRSTDMKDWTPVVTKPRERSVVWNIDRDGTWEKRIPIRDGAPFRPLWAPEIHYFKRTYWITYSIPLGVGGGLLKSVSGKPEGPYVSMFKDKPAVDAIDLALFEDDDGKVYLIWGAGNIRQMNETMDGFVGEVRKLTPANAPRIGFEGTFVFKANGRYYISGAEFVKDPEGGPGADYHAYAASGPALFGPYGPRFLAVPHGGHNSYFKGPDGRWWSTFFGNDPRAPFRERPAALALEFQPDGSFRPKPGE